MTEKKFQIIHTLVDAQGRVAFSGATVMDEASGELRTTAHLLNSDAEHTDRASLSLVEVGSTNVAYSLDFDGHVHRELESNGMIEPLMIALLAPKLDATYRQQQWVNDYAVETGVKVEFNGLSAFLKASESDLENLDTEADFLAQDLTEHQDHSGPFEVDVDNEHARFVVAAWSGRLADLLIDWNTLTPDDLDAAAKKLAEVRPEILVSNPIQPDQPSALKLRATIDVDYLLPPGVDPKDIEESFLRNLQRAIGDGLLTGPHHEAEVDSHRLQVRVFSHVNRTEDPVDNDSSAQEGPRP